MNRQGETGSGMSDTIWHAVGSADSFVDAHPTSHALGGWQVLVARVDGAIVAVNDRCTHAAARLSGGRIRRGAVLCPLHGARFDLASGSCLGGAHAALRRFDVRDIDGIVEIAVPATPPGMDELPVTV
jgi:anthranilate 1,2-dioxygenase ferredoxin component